MKKCVMFLLLITCISGLILGCGKTKNPSMDNTLDNTGNHTQSENTDEGKDAGTASENKTFEALVLENDKGVLVSPNKDTDEWKSSDKISVNIKEAAIYDQKGNKINSNDIKAGDLVEIEYNGMIMESYPAQISCYSVRQKEDTPLMEAYMALIDDIYKEDPGLNSDITMIAMDTTEMTNLTEEQKTRLLLKLGILYGVEIKDSTFDRLAEEGIIDKSNLYFESGILISITKPVFSEKSKELSCGIKKWRSGDGAIGADSVTVKFGGNAWIVTKEGSWIS